MASWKFTDDYGTKYPALEDSILAQLVFSSHTISGANFTGSLDIAATGPKVLGLLSKIISLPSLPIAGTVTEANNTLTVALGSQDANAILNGLKDKLTLIASALRSASLQIGTQVTASQTEDDDSSVADNFSLQMTLHIGSSDVTVSTQVPMGDGFFTIAGEFTGVGVQLSDLGFLMGSLASGNQWFPAQQLGPFAQGSPAFQLLDLALTFYMKSDPFAISVSSVTVSVGITGLPLLGQALYLNPLGVMVTVSPSDAQSKAAVGIHGAMVLCNYDRPGNLTNPDITFTFDMLLGDFSITAELENPSNVTVNTMLQDLMGKGTSLGLSDALTIQKFDLATQADKSSGKISQFSTDIAMSGGFGLLQNFDLQEIAVSVEYNA